MSEHNATLTSCGKDLSRVTSSMWHVPPTTLGQTDTCFEECLSIAGIVGWGAHLELNFRTGNSGSEKTTYFSQHMDRRTSERGTT